MIQIAVVGAGHWGPNLIRNFHNRLTSEVGWVIDIDKTRLEQVKLRFPEVRTGTDVQHALSDPADRCRRHYHSDEYALSACKGCTERREARPGRKANHARR